MSICVHGENYQIWLYTYWSQIPYVLWIVLLRRVNGIPHPFRSWKIKWVCSCCSIWGVYFFIFNWFCLILGSTSLLCTYIYIYNLLEPLSILICHWVSFRIYVKIYHQKLGWSLKKRRDERKIHIYNSSLFVKYMFTELNFLDVCVMCSWVELN